jgi:hypothetical protein
VPQQTSLSLSKAGFHQDGRASAKMKTAPSGRRGSSSKGMMRPVCITICAWSLQGEYAVADYCEGERFLETKPTSIEAGGP